MDITTVLPFVASLRKNANATLCKSLTEDDWN